jgi:hypothetical protein
VVVAVDGTVVDEELVDDELVERRGRVVVVEMVPEEPTGP